MPGTEAVVRETRVKKEQSPVLADEFAGIALPQPVQKCRRACSRPLKARAGRIVVLGIGIGGAGIERIEKDAVAVQSASVIRGKDFADTGSAVLPVKRHAVQHVEPRGVADAGIGAAEEGIAVGQSVAVVVVEVVGGKSRTAGRGKSCRVVAVGGRKRRRCIRAGGHPRTAAVAGKAGVVPHGFTGDACRAQVFADG